MAAVTTVTFQQRKKAGEKITVLTAYDYPTAKLVDEAGVDAILVGDSMGMAIMGRRDTLSVTVDDILHHTRMVTRAVERCFVIADMPFLSYQVNHEEALRNAGRLVAEGGAHAVKIEGGCDKYGDAIATILKAGVPRHGPHRPHPAVRPPVRRLQDPGPRRGRPRASAPRGKRTRGNRLLRVVLECMPPDLAEEITQALHIPTIGIGAGPACDGQVLVMHDMLGWGATRFTKTFADVKGTMKQAFEDYVSEGARGHLPRAGAHLLMIVLRDANEMRDWSLACRAEGKRIGVVPTMGALHEGHASLMRAAAANDDIAVATIFVNPAQFAPHEDFDQYPRTWEADVALAEASGVIAIYAPKASFMYPPGYSTYVTVEGVSEGLCSLTRPHFFRGVATVVTKLFTATLPHRAYFGQKDAQQCAVIKRMAADLDLGVEIVEMPIIREADGLAMSSRNRYLSVEERTRALCISRSLFAAEAMLRAGERDAAKVVAAVRAGISALEIDYVELVDAGTMKPVAQVAGEVTLAVAGLCGTTRLIDNIKFRAD